VCDNPNLRSVSDRRQVGEEGSLQRRMEMQLRLIDQQHASAGAQSSNEVAER
jgi:hypothetical protein